MVNYRFIAFAGVAASLPLNINLGAYSPALVVGDGEISFGGRQDVTGLISALEGAAVSAASGALGNTAPAAAAAPAAAPANVESAAVDPALAEQAQQISSLQGLGKQIAPRVGEKVPIPNMQKRDLAGFDRALKFAEVALTKGPDIQLGTGAEGSGVGIIVDNQPTATEGARAEKRDVGESSAPRRRARITTMYVKRGVPPALQGGVSDVAQREVPITTLTTPSRRDVIDEVNLNVDGDAGITMTFVEADDDDDEE